VVGTTTVPVPRGAYFDNWSVNGQAAATACGLGCGLLSAVSGPFAIESPPRRNWS